MRNYFSYDSACCVLPETVDILTAPAVLPVDLGQLKTHLRISSAITAFDSILTEYVNTAVAKIFEQTRYVLIETEFIARYNCFPTCILLKFRPNVAVSSIVYTDTDGVDQTLATTEYNVYNGKFEAKVCPEDCWPVTKDQTPDAVQVTFTAGFGTTDADVPQAFKTAIYQMVSFMLSNNGDCTDECASAACLGLTSISGASDYRAIGGC